MRAERLRVVFGFNLVAAGTLALLLGVAPAAQADESELRAALDDYSAGRPDEALEKLRAYVAANPEQEEVYGVLREIEHYVLLNAMAKGGEHERLIKYLMRQARPAERARMDDDTAVRDAVAQAVEGENFEVRQRAGAQLRSAGARAVPFLVPHLGSEDATVVVNALMALQQIHSEATPALVEALSSDEPRVRMYTAAALKQTRDDRARPALLRALADADESVKAKAADALSVLGGVEGSAADAYVALGRRYYRDEPGTVRAFSDQMDIWRWEEGTLARYTVPAWLYGPQMAEECAADALALDPAHRGAAALLVRSILAQRGEADAVALAGEEAPESLGSAHDVAKSMGFAAISMALAESLQARDWDVAVACCELVAATYGNESLAGHPLSSALDSDERRVRHAAAIAALRMSPNQGFPGAEKVAGLAAQAAAGGAIRQVLVLDDVDASRGKIVMALEGADYVVGGESRGFVGANRAKMSPTLDVIVVRSNLGETGTTLPSRRMGSSLSVIDELTRDARTKDMRIVVLLDEASSGQNEAVKEVFSAKYGEKVAGFIETPLVEAVVVSTVGAAAEAGDLGPDRDRANATAARAAAAFADTDVSCAVFDLSAAVGPLAEAVRSGPTDEIKAQSIRALGNLRAGGADALAEVLREGADEMKAAAADALGQVLSVVVADDAHVEALVEAAGGEGEVATAALRALGSVRNLTPAQRLEVFRKHRLQVAARAGE